MWSLRSAVMGEPLYFLTLGTVLVCLLLIAAYQAVTKRRERRRR